MKEKLFWELIKIKSKLFLKIFMNGNIRILFFLLTLWQFNFIFAQSLDSNKIISVDTSFTIYSAAAKVVKDFPYAKLVSPKLPAEVDSFNNVEFLNYGKRKLRLDLFVPKNKEKKYPAVILVHGGGWHSGNKSHQVPMAMDFASKGFIAAAVEYRLSAEAVYPAAVKDLKSSIKWMKANSEKYGIDTSKIAILGCSAGAQLASLVGFSNNESEYKPDDFFPEISSDVHAVVNIDGLLDFTSSESKEFDIEPDKPRSAHLWFGSSYKNNPELWKKGSPYFHVDEKDIPIIFINSSIPHYHAGRDDMIKKLDKFNIYYEVYTIENTPHPFWLFHPWYAETFGFVESFLKNVFRLN